jgi:hypothetical protein
MLSNTASYLANLSNLITRFFGTAATQQTVVVVVVSLRRVMKAM